MRSGLRFKLPLVEAIHWIDVQTRTEPYAKANSFSQDHQPAETLYARFGESASFEAHLLTPYVYQEPKIVFVGFNAVRVTQESARLNADIFAAIMNSLNEDPEVVLESIEIENTGYSTQYVQSIEQRMQAEFEVQRIWQQFQQ